MLNNIFEPTIKWIREDLSEAVSAALKLDRDRVLAGSQRWTWERAWVIFRDNLVK